MFIFKETSRNAYKNDRREDYFRKNFYRHFKLNLPHTDAFDHVLRNLMCEQLENLKAHLVSNLIEQKIFRKFRFSEKFHLIAVPKTNENVVTTGDSGRLRWKIENEGFNTQKNLGYGLKHNFSCVSYTAMQNYYQLLQISHMINQLGERGSNVVELLKEHSIQTLADL